MFKRGCLTLVFVAIISATVYSLDVTEEIAKMFPASFGLYRNFFEYSAHRGLHFVEDDSVVDKEPYCFVIIQGDNYIEIKILETNHKSEIIVIWESEMMPGIFSSYDVIRSEGFLSNEIVVATKEKNNLSPNYDKYYLWIFSWQKENTFRLYPKNINENNLITEGFNHIESNKQGDRIRTINIKDNGDSLVRYYRIKDQSILLDEERLSIKQPVMIQSEKLGFKPYLLPIIDHLRSQYPTISIKSISHLGGDSYLYIVESDIGKIVVKMQFDIIETWYVLSDKYSQLIFSTSYNSAYDLNGDGYPDLILEDPVLEPGVLYYILSLYPTQYKLVSPLTHNGESAIWNSGDPLYILRDGEDKPYLLYCFDRFGESKMIWSWNKEKGYFEQIE